MPGPSERLRELRLKTGKEPAEIAHQLGINLPSYYDLESHDSESYMCISLAELRTLCALLTTTPHYLLTGETPPPPHDRRYTFADLAAEIRHYLSTHNLTLPHFEDQAGWELQRFLNDPDTAWEWNIDCLRDVCHELKIDWRCALPS